MPTGYTRDVTEKTSFKDFALKCARAFGACIMMRDDPLDKPIPDEFVADESGYYRKSLEDAIAKQHLWEEMTVTEAKIQMEEENKRQLQCRQEGQKEDDQQLAAYTRMLNLVRQWTPPTPEHEDMKRFMANQLTESIEWDCKDAQFFEECYPTFTGTPGEWLAMKREYAAESVQSAEQRLKEEQDRTAGRNAWVKALRQSLTL